MHKSYSWKSYTFLIISLLVALSMILLDPIATATTEQVGFWIMIFIVVANVASIILMVLTFSNMKRKE
ncbi:hypothetical protein [Bacillus sp. FSL K6-3431]|uniref:hypothetical protein n=1 Tax=Bacillus sp. FSL K6-3431 TaxID=2921500 RepID=UPI0030FAA151